MNCPNCRAYGYTDWCRNCGWIEEEEYEDIRKAEVEKAVKDLKLRACEFCHHETYSLICFRCRSDERRATEQLMEAIWQT